MTTPSALNEYSQAEELARLLLGRVWDALLRLNEWMTGEQAERWR